MSIFNFRFQLYGGYVIIIMLVFTWMSMMLASVNVLVSEYQQGLTQVSFIIFK